MNTGAEKFNGFGPESIGSLQDLMADNTNSWLESHRKNYEQRTLS
jgi:uncharacterized protein (DUF2461 family)